MATGWVVTDPKLKTSAKGTPYIQFLLAERIGKDAYSRVQYYNVWAWDALANQLDHSGVSKGDMLRVKGYLELASYVKSDGVTRDKMLKLRLTEWSTAVKTTAGTAKENGPYPDGNDHGKTAVINGDRENLPG